MNPPFQIGDLVVLTGGGCHQPKSELMAVWTVEQLTPEHAIVTLNPDVQIVELPPLPRKRYPFTWLVLYKPGDTNAGEGEEF